MEHSRNTLGIREIFLIKNPSTPTPKNLKGKKERHLGPSRCLKGEKIYLSTIYFFFTLDLFAMTIHIASFSLKGSSYCNHSHPYQQVKMTCQT
jgi:hypothetical protein